MCACQVILIQALGYGAAHWPQAQACQRRVQVFATRACISGEELVVCALFSLIRGTWALLWVVTHPGDHQHESQLVDTMSVLVARETDEAGEADAEVDAQPG